MRRSSGRRYWAWALAVLLAAAATFVATGCGGDGDEEGESATQIAGLGSTFQEIQEKARSEGQVNLVIWTGYAEKAWAKPFTQATGCQVKTKDGASSDDMVDLMSTGQYDGVSASGDATLRLIAKKDVAPVNLDLIPNYAQVYEGLKGQPHNTVDDVSYGVPHGRGPNLLIFRTDQLPESTDSWAPIWDQASKYTGKLSIYNNPIFIADAAVYLKSTRPELKITNPYELDDKQFQAAVDLLKQQKQYIGEYWDGATYSKQITSFKTGQSAVGTTWQYQVNTLNAEKSAPPIKAVKPKEGTTGWSDTWMISSQAKHPNCMYLWMNHIISPKANAAVAEYFGEAPVSPAACKLTQNKGHCAQNHAADEAYWKDVYYWTTPVADCGDDRGDVCKTYADWRTAWTAIRG
jgi:putative spermidine/putrescine transport system substrate-binding protein